MIEPRVFGDARGFFFESWNQRAFDAGRGPRRALRAGQPLALGARRAARAALPGAAARRASSCAWSRARSSTSPWTCAAPRPRSAAGWASACRPTTAACSGCPRASRTASSCSPSRAEFLYKTTDYYAPEHERTLLWNDPGARASPGRSRAQPVLKPKDAAGAPLAQRRDLPVIRVLVTGAPRPGGRARWRSAGAGACEVDRARSRDARPRRSRRDRASACARRAPT